MFTEDRISNILIVTDERSGFSLKRYSNLCSKALDAEVLSVPFSKSKWTSLLYKLVIIPWTLLRSSKQLIFLPSEKFAYLLLFLPRKKVVAVCHDLHDTMRQDISTLRRIYEKKMIKLLKRARVIVTVSFSTSRELSTLIGQAGMDKISVIHNPIEDIWQEQVESKHLSSLDHIPDKYVLIVGTNAWYKNLDWVFETLLRHQRLTIVKVGALPNSLGATSFDFDLIHLEKVDELELRWLYQSASCLLFPSLHEGFGWPVLEAMVSGCPVIAAKNSSIHEVGGDAPDYFENGDANQMIKLIERVMNDEDHRNKMIEMGKKRAAHFSFDRFKRELNKVVYSTNIE